MPSHEIALVIPIYNEANRFQIVSEYTRQIIEFLNTLSLTAELIFIDDGSSDDSVQRIAAHIEHLHTWASNVSIRHICLPYNTRKAGVYIAAASQTCAEYLLFVDADATFALDDIARLIADRRHSDILVAVRDASIPAESPLRKLMTMTHTRILRRFLPVGIDHAQTGLKLYSSTALKMLIVYVREGHGFASDFILLFYARRLGLRVTAVRVKFSPQPGSHVRLVRDTAQFSLAVAFTLLRPQSPLVSRSHSRLSVLILNWRDIQSPKSGGAEIYTHEVFRRLTDDAEIAHLSPAQHGLPSDEVIDQIHYHRRGNILTVLLHARRLSTHYDIIIDQCNTFRFFTPLWLQRERWVLFIHQLTREIWHHNLPYGLSHLGAWSETAMLRLYRQGNAITVSSSTHNDLVQVGFKPENIWIVPNGFDSESVPQSRDRIDPIFTYLGRFSPYKGIPDLIAAFGALKTTHRAVRLWLIGAHDPRFVEKVIAPALQEYALSYSATDDHADVFLWGYVDEEQKRALLRQSHALVFPAVREGWGRTISEAAMLGVPSIVYRAPGVIDAVDGGRAGFVTNDNTPIALAAEMRRSLDDPMLYQQMCEHAYAFTHSLTWTNSAAKMRAFLHHKAGR